MSRKTSLNGTNGRIRLSRSTLYAVIKRLLESELIEELSDYPIQLTMISVAATTA